MTTTVLPASTKPCSTSSSLRMSSKCKPGRRLVEDVERLAGAAAAQFAGQLDALGLAAGEGRRGLAELDVVEADVVQRLQHRRGSSGTLREVLERLLHVHFQHVVDALASKRTCSVSRLKRRPSQTGQVTQTSARKSISSRFEPLPSHASQRPPGLLKLNRPGL